MLRNRLWELEINDGVHILRYHDPMNESKKMEVILSNEEIKDLYKLLRQAYD